MVEDQKPTSISRRQRSCDGFPATSSTASDDEDVRSVICSTTATTTRVDTVQGSGALLTQDHDCSERYEEGSTTASDLHPPESRHHVDHSDDVLVRTMLGGGAPGTTHRRQPQPGVSPLANDRSHRSTDVPARAVAILRNVSLYRSGDASTSAKRSLVVQNVNMCLRESRLYGITGPSGIGTN